MVLAATTPEFEAFGPWIDRVTSIESVPRLYKGHAIDFEAARLVLKLPRNIARREATPDMDLYDHLLIAGDRSLVILSRSGDWYSNSTIEYSSIVAISESINVLDGSLTLYTANDREYGIEFNGAGARAISELVEVIRADATPDPVSPYGAAPNLSALGTQDTMLVGTLRELQKREPSLRVTAAHGRGSVGYRSGLRRALGRTQVLGGMIVATTATELHIISRLDWVNVLKKPDLSRRHTVINLESIRSVRSEPHPDYEGLVELTIRMESNRYTVVVPEGSDAARAIQSLK